MMDNGKGKEPFNASNLAKVLHNDSVEILEDGVALGKSLLPDVLTALSTLSVENRVAKGLREQVDNILENNIPARVIVGLVGNTGAGKSSIINSLLDEKRLVPTSCMRACTSVVTQISWNAETDESKRYRAEIHFVTAAEWKGELEVLFDEISRDGRLDHEIKKRDSEAGVAYAKVKAVYPNLTDDEIRQSDNADLTEKLLHQKAIAKLLGTVKTVNDSCVESFYKTVQSFVAAEERSMDNLEKTLKDKPGQDSVEKVEDTSDDDCEVKSENTSSDGTDDIEVESRLPQAWPLIKVVKIFTRAPVLSTGVVLVDLPGVQDSNAARAAVAETYIKNCDNLFVVAPINRAVNNKSAKKLLGARFKRQLQLDGKFSGVTFICSKTDDISFGEVVETLGLKKKWAAFDKKVNQKREEMSSMDTKIKETKAAADELDGEGDHLLQKRRQFRKLLTQVQQGKTVYPPLERIKKRKKPAVAAKKKKRNRGFIDSDSDEDSTDEESDDDPMPLTEESINETLQNIQNSLRTIREQSENFDQTIESAKERKVDIEREIESLNCSKLGYCVKARNDYSKNTIQNDFADGIRSLDEESAMKEDESTFDPDKPIRDYKGVARSLNVFCVSSRVFQVLRGRSHSRTSPKGFASLEETQIPQLQEFCMNLTLGSRIRVCQEFLSGMSQLWASLNIWSSDDGDDVSTSHHRDFVQKQLVEFDQDVKNLREAYDTKYKEMVGNERFRAAFLAGVNDAKLASTETVKGWGATREDGGLFWNTYKATCRRNGTHTSFDGVLHDFNYDLAEPMQKQFVPLWEKVFHHEIPAALDVLSKDMYDRLDCFHRTVTCYAKENNLNQSVLDILEEQLENNATLFRHRGERLKTLYSEQQKDCNRSLLPVIAEIMEPTYIECTKEWGPGCFAKMKDMMSKHIDQVKDTMFEKARKKVIHGFIKMNKAALAVLKTQEAELLIRVRGDYENAFGANVNASNEELDARNKVAALLRGSEAEFLKVLKGAGEVHRQDDHMEKIHIKREPCLANEDTDMASFFC